MARHGLRAWQWAALLQFVFAAALPGAQVRRATADASAQAPGSRFGNGGYLASRLLPPKSQASCRPNTGPMYRADVIVTGTDMRQRPWGFAQTMREVLVKSSGDPRLGDDPRTARLARHAIRFVACFDYVDMMAGVPLHDDRGTSDRPHKLTVYFIPAKIDALLAQFGDKPWRGTRPMTVPVLFVHGRKPPPYVLSAEIPAGTEQRAAFASAAGEFGMQVRIPSDAELYAWDASVGHLPSSRHRRAPARPLSPVPSTGTRHYPGGSENGGCAGAVQIISGASAGSITTRRSATSSVAWHSPPRAQVHPTIGLEVEAARNAARPRAERDFVCVVHL